MFPYRPLILHKGVTESVSAKKAGELVHQALVRLGRRSRSDFKPLGKKLQQVRKIHKVLVRKLRV